MLRFIIIIFLFISFLFENPLFAQWPTAMDTALFIDFGSYPYLVVDEGDQSITIAYLRDTGIWAKKFDKFGYPLWDGNHVVLTDTAYGWLIEEVVFSTGQWGAVISDGEGGIIVSWEDYRHATFDFEGFPEGSEVYLQRVDKDGNILYGTHGKKISGPATDGYHFIGDMKPDYHDGFYIGYAKDSIPGISVLKRYDVNGNLYWQRFFPGSFIDLCATDLTGDVFINYNLFENQSRQKLDLFGQMLWPKNLDGVIYDDLGYRHGGAFGDNQGGVIGVGPSGFLRIRRVESDGQYAWDEVDLNEQQQGIIGYAPDKSGGVYICWTQDSMRIQRIDKNGNIKFNPPLKILKTAVGTDIINDGNGGVITIFGTKGDETSNLFAQRFDSSGKKQWADSGISFHTTDDDFFLWPPKRIFSDLNGGAIFLWTECCQGNKVFIKQISNHGKLGDVTTSISENLFIKPIQFNFYQNYPNPFNNSTTISYHLKNSSNVKLIIYDITGREIKVLVNQKQNIGVYDVTFDASGLASGVYYYQLKTTSRIETKKMLLIQ